MPGYNHLDRSERDQIAELRAQGLGATAIAEVIGRDKSTRQPRARAQCSWRWDVPPGFCRRFIPVPPPTPGHP